VLVGRSKKYWPSTMPTNRTLAADKARLAGKTPNRQAHSVVDHLHEALETRGGADHLRV
jgi:hypothetical protein